MIFSLLIGIIVGAAAVIFALQNVAVVTVSFFAWQVTAPLAVILLGTILAGVVLTLLVLLPSVIRDQFYVASIKKQKREAETEFAKYRAAHPDAPVQEPVTVA